MIYKKQAWLVSIIVILLILTQGCKDENSANASGQDLGRIFFDYRISAEEGDEDYLVLLQFRNGGPYKSTITIDSPLLVLFDDKRMIPNSSKFTGPYYETRQPINTMAGTHTIKISTDMGVEHEERVELSPFSLENELDSIVQRGDLVFELVGLKPGSQVRVLLTDTAFFSDGINRIDTVVEGRIVLTRQELEALGNGPVHLELIHEIERPLKGRSPKAGWLSVSYGLSREFQLVGN